MDYNIKYQTRLTSITDIMEHDIQQALDYNVQWTMTSYWKKYLTHPDSEALIKTDIQKDANGGKYTGKIQILIPGQEPLIHESSYFNVIDFINNSFKHFKEELSKKKDE